MLNSFSDQLRNYNYFIVKTAGSRWMQVASDRSRWKAIGETYVQQWTVIGSYDDDDESFYGMFLLLTNWASMLCNSEKVKDMY